MKTSSKLNISNRRLQKLYNHLRNMPKCDNFELNIIHALCVLEKNNGNRTHTCKELKIALRTLRNWIGIMKYWKLKVPDPVKPKKKKN